MQKRSPDASICSFAVNVLEKHLASLQSEFDGVKQAADIEHVHRTRVATRRLRSAIPLFSDCYPAKKTRAWLEDIRLVTRSLGKARDADVQIALVRQVSNDLPDPRMRSGMRRVLLRLSQKRAGLQPQVLQALKQFESSHTIEGILKYTSEHKAAQSHTSHILYKQAAESSLEKLNALLAYEEFIEQPEKIAELHMMRIMAKRLRYTLETFAPLYSNRLETWIDAARKAQDLLGEIHDCDVWVGFLPGFMVKERERTFRFYGRYGPYNHLVPGLDYFLKNRQDQRAEVYRQFVTQWKKWRKANMWGSLVAQVEAPILETDNLFPVPQAVNSPPKDDPSI